MPRRRTSVFEKMFTDNRLRSIPNSEVQGTLSVPYGDILCASCTPIFALLTKGYHCGGHYQTFY